MSLFDKMMSSVNPPASPQNVEGGKVLNPEWKSDRHILLKDPAPENLDELKAVVDVQDPGSIAAYWVYSVMALTADFDTGMSMMKYLYADIEPFGRGYTEGGKSGRAGWDTYFNDRLRDDEYRWLPRAYFVNATAENGFHPSQPLSLLLHYNSPVTEALNSQTLKQLGRLNIVYWVQSNAAGNKVNIEISHFDGGSRWYVTKGSSSSSLFYDQRGGLTAEARGKLWT